MLHLAALFPSPTLPCPFRRRLRHQDGNFGGEANSPSADAYYLEDSFYSHYYVDVALQATLSIDVPLFAGLHIVADIVALYSAVAAWWISISSED